MLLERRCRALFSWLESPSVYESSSLARRTGGGSRPSRWLGKMHPKGLISVDRIHACINENLCECHSAISHGTSQKCCDRPRRRMGVLSNVADCGLIKIGHENRFCQAQHLVFPKGKIWWPYGRLSQHELEKRLGHREVDSTPSNQKPPRASKEHYAFTSIRTTPHQGKFSIRVDRPLSLPRMAHHSVLHATQSNHSPPIYTS